MAYTDKQIRNGATGSGGERPSGQSGPIPNVAPLVPASEAAAVDRGGDGRTLMETPAGSGPDTGGSRVLGGGGSFWDWDSGLAVSEQPGEASDV